MSLLFNSLILSLSHSPDEYSSEYWHSLNSKLIDQTASSKPNTNRAKNVIFFLGDGMSLVTLTASRIFKGQQSQHSGEEGSLYFETFPNFSPIKTYNVDRQVPDSAGTATTFTSGVKANFMVIGCNALISSSDTDCDKMNANAVTSILQWAVDAGKVAGLVTTTRITHATPAATYAHVANRDWEDDSTFPVNITGACKDIASQLIDNKPGMNLSVILGGGWRSFYPNNSLAQVKGRRKDGRNLINDWLQNQKLSHQSEDEYTFVNDSISLRKAVEKSTVTSLFGLFSASHLAYEAERNTQPNGEPSLTEMVKAALTVLKRADKDNNGFVLFVEGGRIDHAHHENKANMALRETLQLDNAVETASKTVKIDETLIMVTADHAHTLTINGYPTRGSKIDGGSFTYEKGGINQTDVTYGVLMYGNGPGHQTKQPVDLTHSNEPTAKAHSAVYLTDSAHGGEDVGIYAIGPWAHLFTGLKDQSYIPHVAAYASCIGQFSHANHCKSQSSPYKGAGYSFVPSYILLFASIFLLIIFN